MKNNRKTVFSLLVLAGLGFTNAAWSMEEEAAGAAAGAGAAGEGYEELEAARKLKKPRGEEYIRLISAEEQEIIISRGAAELSGTIKGILASLQEAELSVPVPVEVSTPVLQEVVNILGRVKGELIPRQDGGYIAYKVQLIIDEVLENKSFDEIKDTLLAADYLYIPFLVNAAARVLVYKDEVFVRNIVNQVFLVGPSGETINSGEIIPLGDHIYLKKHLKLKAAGVSREYSIADLVEAEAVRLSGEVRVLLYNKGLTSLYGIKQLDPTIYGGAKVLYLRNNYILDHEHDPDFPQRPFEQFTNLEVLDLSDNRLNTLPEETFRGLDRLEELDLSDNQLNSLPSGIFNGLEYIATLNLSDNQLSTLPGNIFEGLYLGTLDLSDNRLNTLPEGIFGDLDGLEELFLFNNQLSSLSSRIFSGMVNLSLLDLSNNQLSALPENIFEGLYLGQLLDLSDNPLPEEQKAQIRAFFEGTDANFYL